MNFGKCEDLSLDMNQPTLSNYLNICWSAKVLFKNALDEPEATTKSDLDSGIVEIKETFLGFCLQ